MCSEMLRLPSLLNYQMAVQNPELAFANDSILRTGEPRRNPLRMPVVASGGFAATFQILVGESVWAVRCFHKNESVDRQLARRYQHIARLTAEPSLSRFLVPVHYQSDGIIVDAVAYPTVRMPWVDGVPLGIWLDDWAADPTPDRSRLDRVREEISTAVRALRRRGVAHGDLQHGNILILPDDSIRLIDYDGMFATELAEFGSIERGHRNYQHPDRHVHFDDTLDIFAAESIDLSLRALREDPELWDRFGGTGENMLFEAADFAAPEKSAVFAELERLPALREQVRRFGRACRTTYREMPAALQGRSAEPARGMRDVQNGLVVAAENRRRLLELQGQVVTVFGTVHSTNVVGSIALVNLGLWRQGDFTIVGFGGVKNALISRYGVQTSRYNKKFLPRLARKRVAITGTLVVYVADRQEGNHVPQIELARVSGLRELDDNQFRALAAAANASGSVDDLASRPSDEPGERVASDARTSPRTAAVPDPESARRARLAQLDEMYRGRGGSSTQRSPAPTPRHVPSPPPPVPAAYRRESVRRTGSPDPSSGGGLGPGPPPESWRRSASPSQTVTPAPRYSSAVVICAVAGALLVAFLLVVVVA